MKLRTPISFALALSLGLVSACSTPAGTGNGAPSDKTQVAATEARPRLWLAQTSEAGDETVDLDLNYVQGEKTDGPRVLEVRVSSDGPFSFDSASAGDALTQAGKELKVQEPAPGIIRVLAYSASSTSAVHSGVLAHLTLHRNGPGKGRFDIITDRPLFAPQSAQTGLIIGDPLEL